MKKSQSKIISSLAIISFFFLFIPAVLSAAEYKIAALPELPPPGFVTYDDFDSPAIETLLWNINDPGSILSQSGGFLNASTPPNAVFGGLHSTQEFSGDFEIILHYSQFQTSATEFEGNSPQISLAVNSQSTTGDFIFIFRGFDGGGHMFLTNGVINGEWQHTYKGYGPATTTSGILQLSRTGSTITASYDEGTGWVDLASFPDAFTGVITIQVSAYTGDDGIFHVASDGVYYQLANPAIIPGTMLLLME